MTTTLKILVFAGALYALILLFLYFLQSYLLFPVRLASRLPLNPPVDAEVHWIETSFGKVESWYLPPFGSSPGKAPAVLFAHGNADLISSWPEDFTLFRKWGMGVMLVEFPGYGRSRGKPREDTILEVFAKGYDLLSARPEIDEQRIAFFGHSMGGGAVCALSRQRSSAAMILMATFTSIPDMAPKLMLPSLLLRTRFNNLAVVQKYENPLLVIHGNRDSVIPYKHGMRLHEAAARSKLLPLDCGHNDCLLGRNFWEEIRFFLVDAGVLIEKIDAR